MNKSQVFRCVTSAHFKLNKLKIRKASTDRYDQIEAEQV